MYNFQAVKEAILFNTQEVLPSDPKQLDLEIQKLVDLANSSGQKIRHYIGFEISGQIHIGTGMMTAIKIKKLQDAGVCCSIFLANYHTWLNSKLDGKMESILQVKNKYFQPVFEKCLEAEGCNLAEIEFVGSEVLYSNKNQKGQMYWDYMMKAAKNLTLARVNKSITITGKKEGEGVEFGILCYPVMQVADPFFMQAHIVHAGMDQRKCHVLMREVAGGMNEGYGLNIGNEGDTGVKPIAAHHNLLLSLGIDAKSVLSKMDAKKAENASSEVETDDDLKMSKSKPDSAVWVTDSLEEISRKLKKAYCPMIDPNLSGEDNQETQKYNPILNWCQFLIYPAGKELHIINPKFELDQKYPNFGELESDYLAGKIHPLDLKDAVARCLADWFAPIRDWGDKNQETIDWVKSLRK